MPVELTHALLIDSLARRYGVLPSSVLAESAEVLRIIDLVEAYRAE